MNRISIEIVGDHQEQLRHMDLELEGLGTWGLSLDLGELREELEGHRWPKIRVKLARADDLADDAVCALEVGGHMRDYCTVHETWHYPPR